MSNFHIRKDILLLLHYRKLCKILGQLYVNYPIPITDKNGLEIKIKDLQKKKLRRGQGTDKGKPGMSLFDIFPVTECYKMHMNINLTMHISVCRSRIF